MDTDVRGFFSPLAVAGRGGFEVADLVGPVLSTGLLLLLGGRL